MVIFLFLIWRKTLVFSSSLFRSSVVGMIWCLLLPPQEKKLNSILDEISYEPFITRTDWTSMNIRVSRSLSLSLSLSLSKLLE